MLFVLILLIVSNFIPVVPASDVETKGKYFEKYVEKNLNIEFKESKSYFLFIDAAGSETCKPLDFDFLDKITNNENVSLYFIYPKNTKLPESLKKMLVKKNVYLENGKYKKINITPLSDGLIITENNKVKEIYEVNGYWNRKHLSKYFHFLE